ncbi:RagB/SusD family nutrient uptake outer membrane protein [Mucilaginibacter sabulilitoris]|uniref:RagB/SusD family nutrient uptake outer membrane protein n=1 Tax=Mucilaginibacter sabulilitoris TaxID=1173583 RepID=A0ABZ0TTI9_9SPHI|nr:RagB/SusD family nutrient uptake outer membrane protein [Mucilaginibacter sabulilitoris]WPU96392.1 RagB/SusD family nutrient uptake outer membrane protein [Mucilaginibacter sabulilitoris]
MKNHISKILLIMIAFIALICGCKKSEQFPVDKVTSYYVFNPLDSAGTSAQGYLYQIYAIVKNGHNRVSGDYLDAASDDAVSSKSGTIPVTLISTNGVNSLSFPANENFWEESNATGIPSNSGTPSSYWAGIRAANEFITKIGVVPVKGQSPTGVPTRYVWQSEARFLRAYFYFELVKRYGGVPLLGDKVFTLNDNVSLPRSSFADCIKYIVSECNAIKDSLLTYPLVTPDADNYRPTKGAAMALKARALLYAASPLFNGGNIDPANPLTGYTDFQADRWAQAATAALDVINLGTYKLDVDYKDIFLTQNNSERIWIRPNSISTDVEGTNGPVGFAVGGTGNTSPTQELVNSFPMQNGLPITDPASGYNPSDPYATFTTPARDPRLTANIFYNGSPWLNTTVQTYEGGQSKPNANLQQTHTGYYMRKFMGLSEKSATLVTHSTDWVVLRYAEILLSFAEARNEVEGSPQADVYKQLTDIRARAGIDPGASGNYGLKPNMTKEEMRAVIQNEWRIEFAFEEHRFFDIRRWKIAEGVMNQPRTGVSIVKIGPTLTFNPITVLSTAFTKKQYLYPIPYNEVAKNPNMKQNPGW